MINLLIWLIFTICTGVRSRNVTIVILFLIYNICMYKIWWTKQDLLNRYKNFVDLIIVLSIPSDFFYVLLQLQNKNSKIVQLDKKFQEILEIWNATIAEIWPGMNLKKKFFWAKKKALWFGFCDVECLALYPIKWWILLLLWKKKKESVKCALFQLFFQILKRILKKNMVDVNFSFSYYSKFWFELLKLFDEYKICIDCFLYQEYTFAGRDLTTGETWRVPLSESIRYSKKPKIAKLKADKLPVPAEFAINFSIPDIWFF